MTRNVATDLWFIAFSSFADLKVGATVLTWEALSGCVQNGVAKGFWHRLPSSGNVRALLGLVCFSDCRFGAGLKGRCYVCPDFENKQMEQGGPVTA